jgi:hypothetical protein
VHPSHFAAATGWKIEPRSISRANELRGHQQNLLAQGLKSRVLKLGRQAQAA